MEKSFEQKRPDEGLGGSTAPVEGRPADDGQPHDTVAAMTAKLNAGLRTAKEKGKALFGKLKGRLPRTSHK